MIRTLIGITMLFFAITGNSKATPIFFSDTGSYYEFVDPPSLSWVSARAAAAASTYLGRQGHLVTITSAVENDFIINILGISATVWIGAQRSGSLWSWVEGPDLGTVFWNGGSGGSPVGNEYSNWSANEPSLGIENVVEMNTSGVWNDRPSYAFASAYVVEYSASTTEVSEPSSFFFAGLSILGLVFFRLFQGIEFDSTNRRMLSVSSALNR